MSIESKQNGGVSVIAIDTDTDAGALLEVLGPFEKGVPQMSLHYNAFISYKHGAEDTVAVGGVPNCILCFYANKAVLFRMEDGSVYDSIEFEGQILSFFMNTSGGLSFILSNGNIGSN